MQRGQEEDQRERVCCQNEQRDDRRAPSSATVCARELLVAADGASRHEPVPRDDPAAERDDPSASSASTGQSPDEATAGFGGRGAPVGHAPSTRKAREHEPDEEPEGEAAAQAARRRKQREPSSPAVGEEVDDRDDERDEQAEEQELDRPAAHDAVAGPDVARRPLRELEPLVERAERAPGSRAPARPAGSCRARSRGR